jgi:hypothetical protein
VKRRCGNASIFCMRLNFKELLRKEDSASDEADFSQKR